MKATRCLKAVVLLGLLLSGACSLTGCEGSSAASSSELNSAQHTSASTPVSDSGTAVGNDSAFCVAYGDSITIGDGAGGPSYPDRLSGMLGKSVVNMGMPGATSGQGAAGIQGVLGGYRPHYILIMFGANDLEQGLSVSSIADNTRSMARTARANGTVPVVATMPPMTAYGGNVAAANGLIRQAASDEGAVLVDLERAFGNGSGLMGGDGVHPNAAGTEIMANAFYSKLH